MVLSYEVFGYMFCKFKKSFEDKPLIFTQKYVVGQQLISVYMIGNTADFEAKRALDYLNDFQRKYVEQAGWTPFFLSVVKSFDDYHDNFCYKFVSKNPKEKEMYEHFSH